MGRDLEALFTEFRGLIRSGADVGRILPLSDGADRYVTHLLSVVAARRNEWEEAVRLATAMQSEGLTELHIVNGLLRKLNKEPSARRPES